MENQTNGRCTTSDNNDRDTYTGIDDYLKEFHPLLTLLRTADSRHTDNIVIGGMVALHVHGLEMHRPPNDMDVIIYSPTPQQKSALTLLKTISAAIPGVEVSEQKVIKIVRNGKHMDIIQSPFDFPRGLLLHRTRHCVEPNSQETSDRYAVLHGELYQIQSIQNTIAAKRGYHLSKRGMNGEGQFGLKLFVRSKDVADFMALKNNNFNLQ